MAQIPPIIEVGGVLLSSDVLTEFFSCDYERCKGICCVEGDAGAPVTMDEIGSIESALDTVWADLSASAQSVIDRQGVAYTDRDGDLVTSIVRGRECVFARSMSPGGGPTPDATGEATGEPCWLCMLERAYRQGRTAFCKPVSCALYPVREKRFPGGLTGLNYHRWHVCEDAVRKGRAEGVHVYEFLREPLTRRFGADWYRELCDVAEALRAEGLL